MRLLLSARDVGSAHHVTALVRLARHHRMPAHITLVGAGAAVPILVRSGVPVIKWRNAATVPSSAAKRSARRLINQHRPHIVMPGLAFPGHGPDEALFEAAREASIPTACIQDFWGYLGGFASGRAPDVFFVHDTLARRLTIARLGAGARVVIAGSPRHEWSGLSGGAVSARRSRVPGQARRLVFIGQPSQFPGVGQNLRHFIAALRQLKGPLHIAFRRHPNDAASDEHYIRLFQRQPHPLVISPSTVPMENLLLEADLVATCYSSVGLDHHYLQLRVRQSLAPVLFITVGRSLRRFLRTQNGFEEVPNVRLGFAAGVSRADRLPAALRRLLRPAEANRYRHRIRRGLSSLRNSCVLIFRHLHQLTAQTL